MDRKSGIIYEGLGVFLVPALSLLYSLLWSVMIRLLGFF